MSTKKRSRKIKSANKAVKKALKRQDILHKMQITMITTANIAITNAVTASIFAKSFRTGGVIRRLNNGMEVVKTNASTIKNLQRELKSINDDAIQT